MIDFMMAERLLIRANIGLLHLPHRGTLGYTGRVEELSKLETINLNIRLLVWRQTPNPDAWVAILNKKTGIPKDRADALLNGSRPNADEVDKIVAAFEPDAEEFRSNRLLGMMPEEVLKENAKFLLDQLPRGEKKLAAEKLGVTPETVSRWTKKRTPPTKGNQAALLRYMGLDSDSMVQPLFLSIRPISAIGKKKWLRERLEQMLPQDLASLFPALRKLLDRHEGH